MNTKLSEREQERLDYIRKVAAQYGTCGAGNIENPKDQGDKRTRKLYDLGLVFMVGVGQRTKDGWTGGGGLIPAEMFDATKHTKLSFEKPALTIEEEDCKNSLNMPIKNYRVVLDNVTIGEFRDPYWANYLINAIKRDGR